MVLCQCLKFWSETKNMKEDNDQHEDMKTTSSEIHQMEMTPCEAVNSSIDSPSMYLIVKKGSSSNNNINYASSDMTTPASKCVTTYPDVPNHYEVFSDESIKSAPVIDDASTLTPPSTIKNATGTESPATWLCPKFVVVSEPELKAGSFRTPIKKGHGRQYSDWADLYEGVSSLQITKRASWKTCMSGATSTWSDHVTARESCLPPLTSTPKKLTIPLGKVMGMFLDKQKYRPKVLNLKSTVDEVVNLFLSVETGAILPVSMTETDKPPTVMNSSLMAMTLADNLGSKFDAKTKGLTFCIGPVNSILCYKMTVCELSTMEKILAIFCMDFILPVE